MAFAYIIIGMILGSIAAAISLFLGSSVLLTVAVYSGVGSISIIILAAFRYVQQTLVEKKAKKHDVIERLWQSL